MNPILIFTDGSSRGNPGPGGWGAILIVPEQNEKNYESGSMKYEVREIGGREEHTTNNRMELTAVIRSLSIIHNSKFVIQIFSDSKYVITGITKWVHSWIKNNWINSQKKPVENRDLWEELTALAKQFQIEWKYVAGHTGHPANERCDEIATSFADNTPPKLYSGVLENYRIDISGLSSEANATNVKPFYLSMVEGVIERHDSWAECEKRVKGKSGVKFKKIKSRHEAETVTESWKKEKGNR